MACTRSLRAGAAQLLPDFRSVVSNQLLFATTISSRHRSMGSNPRTSASSQTASAMTGIDSSPVEIEPNIVDEDEEGDDDEDDDEALRSGSLRFALPSAAVVWLVAVIVIIMSLLKNPLLMVCALVTVNIVFPVICFVHWFVSRSNYELLDMEEGKH
jgi:hypothetical protein